MNASRDLLLEIGVEELPASFVDAALQALPKLATKRLADLHLAHGTITAMGTPRRLALVVEGLVTGQPDRSEELVGPPVSAAYDKAGKPTRAAEAFATKIGISLSDLKTIDTPKGRYLAGVRYETGRSTSELLGPLLAALCAEIPFRKTMRWGDGDATFGRPVRWLVGLFGEEVIPFSFAGHHSDRITYGHRFLAPGAISLPSPSHYTDRLAKAHVIAHPDARKTLLLERLNEAATKTGGTRIEDAFLVQENLSLVEEPHVIVGGFEERFLALPEEVILEVARGHQRYFGVRSSTGALLPRYLAVVNTALQPDTIRRGNDRVMRARLADAQFFYQEDLRIPLRERLPKLEGIIFQHRLGTMGAKVKRVVRLVEALGRALPIGYANVTAAKHGAELAKCDLVSLMVGEFPELQGVMGRAYALAQGEPSEVADVVRDHYLPKGASDAIASTETAALVAIADRLDSLAGCFSIGLVPTGAADPYALRRACLAVLRTLLGRGWDTPLSPLFRLAHQGLVEQGVKLDLDEAACAAKLSEFFRDRLRYLLSEELPADVVEACLAVVAEQPVEVRSRSLALTALTPSVRAKVGEVFKRVFQIAKDAGEGEPAPPHKFETAPHPSELALFEAYQLLRRDLSQAAQESDYERAFHAIADLAPKLQDYFTHVYVMTDDIALRVNRLCLLRSVRDACSTIAHFQLLQ